MFLEGLQHEPEYAFERLIQCVLDDPSNPRYVCALLGSLYREHKDDHHRGVVFLLRRILSLFRERPARTALEEAERNRDWAEVIRNGIRLIASNPWDAPTLRSLAAATRETGNSECELIYLNAAFIADPEDPATDAQASVG